MRQFAEFVITNRRRVTLQGMHDSPDGAHGFEIARLLFELQRLFVERLQQFQCSLKEELFQFRRAFVRKLAHGVTSIC